MLIGQIQNGTEDTVFGRLWFFMALQGKDYAISREYSATGNDIFEIVQILKALRNILFKRLNLIKT